MVDALDLAVPIAKINEGFRSRPYKDSRGNLTVGYGFCPSAGITPYAAEELLRAQLQELYEALTVYTWYQDLDAPRQAVLLDMGLNLGLSGLVDGFPRMIQALQSHEWQQAANECHVTEPELAGRYAKNAQTLLTGEL